MHNFPPQIPYRKWTEFFFCLFLHHVVENSHSDLRWWQIFNKHVSERATLCVLLFRERVLIFLSRGGAVEWAAFLLLFLLSLSLFLRLSVTLCLCLSDGETGLQGNSSAAQRQSLGTDAGRGGSQERHPVQVWGMFTMISVNDDQVSLTRYVHGFSQNSLTKMLMLDQKSRDVEY